YYWSLLQTGEQVGARLSDFALRRGRARECRPAALLDVRVLHPRTGLFQLSHVRRDIRLKSELVGTHGGKNRDDGATRTLIGHLLRGAPQCSSGARSRTNACKTVRPYIFYANEN